MSFRMLAKTASSFNHRNNLSQALYHWRLAHLVEDILASQRIISWLLQGLDIGCAESGYYRFWLILSMWLYHKNNGVDGNESWN